jgi:hypothetical protein
MQVGVPCGLHTCIRVTGNEGCCPAAFLHPLTGGVDQLQQLLQCAAGPTTPAGPSDPDHRNSSSSSSGGSGRATPAPTTATTGLGLPSLCHLCVGWGFSTHTLAWLLRCSPALTRLEVGQGANADDSLLRLLAAACPHLRHLRLSLAAVTSTGGSATGVTTVRRLVIAPHLAAWVYALVYPQ